MSRILLVGRGFIGQAITAALPPPSVRVAGHADIGSEGLLTGIDTVVYAGRHPALGGESWSLDEDAELALARAASSASARARSTRHRRGPWPRPTASGLSTVTADRSWRWSTSSWRPWASA